jgi:hypothetical protein
MDLMRCHVYRNTCSMEIFTRERPLKLGSLRQADQEQWPIACDGFMREGIIIGLKFSSHGSRTWYLADLHRVSGSEPSALSFSYRFKCSPNFTSCYPRRLEIRPRGDPGNAHISD